MLHRDHYMSMAQLVADAVQAAGMLPVDLVLQCGSGLGSIPAELIPGAQELPMAGLPHLPASLVAGHGRSLLYGKVGKASVLVFSGRFHLYEGHSPLTAALPAAIAAALGAKLFVLTNAAGGLNQHYATGSVMLHSDYINFQGDNVLAHLETEDAAERFIDPKPPYDLRAAAALGQHLSAQQLAVHQGVYIAVRGPIFETMAELRMMRSFGADAVGMSSVPEVMMCNFLSLPVVGLSVITNECFGPRQLSHTEVVANSNLVSSQIGRALRAFLD